DAAGTVFQHGMHVKDRQAQRLVGTFQTAVYGTERAIVGSNPQQACVVLCDRSHKIGSLACGDGISMKNAVLPLNQAAAVGADPQAPITGGQQAKNTVFLKGRCVLMGKQVE